MGLRDIVDALVTSEPFEQLLLERARPIVARAEAAEDLVAAAVAVALDAPVMAVTSGPARGRGAGRRPGRLPRPRAGGAAAVMGSAAVRGHLARHRRWPRAGPGPSRGCARPRARSCWWPPRSPRCRARSPRWAPSRPWNWWPARNSRPTRWPSGSWTSATRAPTSWSAAASSRCAAASSTSSPAPRGARCGWSTWGDEIESLREFVPSTQLSTDKVAHVEIPPVRELIPDDALRQRAAEVAAAARRPVRAISCNAWPTGCSSRARRRWRRSCSTRCPTPVELLPEGAWVVVCRAQRTFDRARQAHLEAEALAEALGWPAAAGVASRWRTRCAAACNCTSRSSPRASTWGWATGAARRATRASWRTVCSDLSAIGLPAGRSRRAGTARSHACARSWATCPSRRSRRRWRTGSCSPPASWPSPPRRTCSARGATRARRRGSRDGATESVADELEPGRLRRPPDPRGGPLRGHHAPRAGGRRARLPDPGVRARATVCSCPRTRWAWWRGTWAATRPRLHRMGGIGLGARHREGEARRQGHGGRAGPPLHRADVGAGPRVRARHALAGRAGGCLPPRGDRRPARPPSTRSSATWSCPSRWTG